MKTRKPLSTRGLPAIACALATLALMGCGAGIVKPGSVNGLCQVLADSAGRLGPGQAGDEIFEEGIAAGCWTRKKS